MDRQQSSAASTGLQILAITTFAAVAGVAAGAALVWWKTASATPDGSQPDGKRAPSGKLKSRSDSSGTGAAVPLFDSVQVRSFHQALPMPKRCHFAKP